jgi:peroxiredoxin
LPDIESRFVRKYGDKVEVIAIDANGDALDGVQRFVSNLHVSYAVGLEDPSTKTYAALTQNYKGSNPFPVDVVVDKDGIITYIAREYDPDGIARAVEAALAK